jgi:hypothetical protein
VPDGADNGRLLGDGMMTFPNELINAINFYDPGTLAETPMEAMMELALMQFSAQEESGRYRAIIIFSDADSLENQLQFDLLTEIAESLNVSIFTAILGLRADPNEIVSAELLGDPTNGFWVHMPQPADIEPIYQVVQGNGVQTRVVYRSQINTAGEHTLELTLGGITGAASFELDVQPPAVQLMIDNSRPIRRVAAEHDAPLAEIEPTSQLVVAQVTWPDGRRRGLSGAALLVDGVAQPGSDAVVITGDGLLNFDWAIGGLDAGVYNLTVRITDELGKEANSEPLALSIEISRPSPPEEESTDESEGDAVAAPTAETPGILDVSQGLGIVSIIIGVVAILFAMFMVIVAVIIARRRGGGPADPQAAAAPPAGGLPHDATQIMMPAFALPRSGGAYLEPLENAPDYAVPIQLAQANTAIGRDPKLAQIVFNDKSVSRLHARIMESGGQYRLYDEGSASGTYLNFERISLTPQPLKDNDDIHIGRVHLRFRMTAPEADSDSTQIMNPIQRPGRAAPAPAADDLSTQPFMPHQPPSPGQPQSPGKDDPDDISTQPYMPHSPRR